MRLWFFRGMGQNRETVQAGAPGEWGACSSDIYRADAGREPGLTAGWSRGADSVADVLAVTRGSLAARNTRCCLAGAAKTAQPGI